MQISRIKLKRGINNERLVIIFAYHCRPFPHSIPSCNIITGKKIEAELEKKDKELAFYYEQHLSNLKKL